MTAFTRAGADIIITYHARDIVEKGWFVERKNGPE